MNYYARPTPTISERSQRPPSVESRVLTREVSERKPTVADTSSSASRDSSNDSDSVISRSESYRSSMSHQSDGESASEGKSESVEIDLTESDSDGEIFPLSPEHPGVVTVSASPESRVESVKVSTSPKARAEMIIEDVKPDAEPIVEEQAQEVKSKRVSDVSDRSDGNKSGRSDRSSRKSAREQSECREVLRVARAKEEDTRGKLKIVDVNTQFQEIIDSYERELQICNDFLQQQTEDGNRLIERCEWLEHQNALLRARAESAEQTMSEYLFNLTSI